MVTIHSIHDPPDNVQNDKSEMKLHWVVLDRPFCWFSSFLYLSRPRFVFVRCISGHPIIQCSESIKTRSPSDANKLFEAFGLRISVQTQI
jgi:hypothetical protein